MELTIQKKIQNVLDALRRNGYEAYLVGGCVRDTLLGRAPNDWDVCTNAQPREMKRCFAGFRVIETGLAHGTVTVLSQGEPVEVTTYRTDGAYSDGRHPDEVHFAGKLSDDLSRRDFTVNAMAYTPGEGLVDLYGGVADLNSGLIRCVGEAEARFSEDALRILRALRFAARYGFRVEEKTAAAMATQRSMLRHVSAERVFSELKGILIGKGAGEMLRAFPSVFFEVLPELAPEYGFEQNNPYHIHDVWTHTSCAVDAIEPDPVLRLVMLLHDVAKPEKYFTDEEGVGHFYGHADAGAAQADAILRRLRADNDTREAVARLIAYHDIEPPQTEKAVRRLVAKLGMAECRRLIACWTADSADRAPDVKAHHLRIIGVTEGILDKMEENERCFSLKELAVNGGDILALGLPEGPAVGRILGALFDLVLDGELPNEREALLQKAAELAKGKK